MIAIAIAAVVYGIGVWKLRRRGRSVPAGRVIAMYAALALSAIAIVGLDAAASTLLSMHMVQHLALMMAIPPLIVWSRPRGPFLVALPHGGRRVVARAGRAPWVRRAVAGSRRPLVVALSGAVALWAWHLPSLYQAALRSESVHVIEHFSFVASGLLLWDAVKVGFGRERTRRAFALAIVFATTLQSAALGAILTFANSPLYPIHATHTLRTGADPLVDQQLAGVLMWIPPGIVYLIVMIGLVSRWFSETDERDVRAATAGERP